MSLIDKFLSGKIQINCKTEKDAEELLRFCYSQGYTWSSGSSLLDYTNWGIYEENTVYSAYPFEKAIAYTVVSCYDNNSTIVEYKNLCNKFRRL